MPMKIISTIKNINTCSSYCFKTLVTQFFPNRFLASLIITIILAESIVHGFHENSYWANKHLSLSAKWGLVCITILSWIVTTWIAYWYARLIRSILRNINSAVSKSIVYLLTIFPLIICINFYVFSWYYFWRLGIFPTLNAFYFSVINANMLHEYFWQAERYIYLICMGCFFAISLFSIYSIKIYSKKFCRTESSLIVPQLVILLVSGNAAYLVINFAKESTLTNAFSQNAYERIAVVKDPWAPYSYELCYHVSPSISILSDALQINEPEIEGLISLDYLKPKVSLKPYSFPEIAAKNKKNIILITIESLRSDSILMRHQNKLVMPHLASLAKEGHFFPECYANSTHSDYSDPAILSSLYPLRTTKPHFYSKQDPWSKVLIYDFVKQYGYATAMISSQNEAWSNMHLFYESPNLDFFFDSRSYQTSVVKEKEDYLAWQKKLGMTAWLKETGMIAGKLDDAITIKKAIDWISEKRNSQLPFFVSINLQTSHFPYQRSDGKQGPFYPCKLGNHVSLLHYQDKDIPIVKNAYYNALTYVDSQIKQLTDELDRSKIRDETILIITGDHGEAFFENGIRGHAGKPLETVVKTGLIINNPKSIRAKKDGYLVQAVDIAPTISGVLGVPPHPSFQGINVLSSKRPPNNTRFVFIHSCNTLGSIDALVSGTGWKLINDMRVGRNELYFRPTDLEPHENLIFQESNVFNILNLHIQKWRTNQLLYYSNPKYYNFFYPPKNPILDPAKLRRLIKSAHQ